MRVSYNVDVGHELRDYYEANSCGHDGALEEYNVTSSWVADGGSGTRKANATSTTMRLR